MAGESSPQVFSTIDEMRSWSRTQRLKGNTIALVPTMGYLHQGHLSLVQQAKHHASSIVVSVYVNPGQFSPTEDLTSYPSDFQGDLRKLKELGCVDAVFHPRDLYRTAVERDGNGGKEGEVKRGEGVSCVEDGGGIGHQTWIRVERIEKNLCGKSRPVFFRGVATVVAKLFNIMEPDLAVFGKKDYQQWKLICRMVQDLNFPVRIIGSEIVRDPDGLAMSSRNVRLKAEEREKALSIYRSLCKARMDVQSGQRSSGELRASILQSITEAGGRIDYAEVVDQETLESVESVGGPVVVCIAAWFGTVRLIDNMEINGGLIGCTMFLNPAYCIVAAYITVSFTKTSVLLPGTDMARRCSPTTHLLLLYHLLLSIVSPTDAMSDLAGAGSANDSSTTPRAGAGALFGRPILWRVLGFAMLIVIFFIILCCRCIYLRRKKYMPLPTTPTSPLNSNESATSTSQLIPIDDLRHATNNFSKDNIIGSGGFGVVYKGELRDGRKVAVKRMEGVSQGTKEFEAEIRVLEKAMHKNLVHLHGYCDDGSERLLVYEYMPQGTLANHLFDGDDNQLCRLNWNQRLLIALDVARGMEFLHSLGKDTFIHRDLKPSNILLGNDLRAKVSDFGLVRLAPKGKHSFFTEIAAGTYGYIAPEYANTGRVNTLCDVYAFGVILMAIITGRKPLDESILNEHYSFVSWFGKEDDVINIADPSLTLDHEDEETRQNVRTLAQLARGCASVDPQGRPDMSQAVTFISSLVEKWEPNREDEEATEDIIPLSRALEIWREEDGKSDGDFFGDRTVPEAMVDSEPLEHSTEPPDDDVSI